MTRFHSIAIAAATALVLSRATPALAQTGDNRSKWEFEAHGGFVAPNQPTAGATALPPPAQPLPQISFFTGTPTRAVSSWLLGDGAVLANQALSSVRIRQLIVPVDPLAERAFAQRGAGGGIGFRVSREISERLRVELNVDYVPITWTVDAGSRSALESSRASFAPAWQALVGPSLLITPRDISAVSAIDERTGSDLTTTGTLNIALRRARGLRPYVALGAGVVAHRGEMPAIALTGHYRFDFTPPVPSPIPATFIDQTDAVTIRATRTDRQLIGVIGGGVTRDVSPRLTLRADVRAHLGSNPLRTIVTATPSTAASPSNLILSFGTTPPLFFSSIPGISNLSGPPVSGFTTFTGRGMTEQIHVTAGLAWHF